jgi:surface protein
MFQGCSAFDKPLDNWHVDNVESMATMFDGCSAFNQPLNNWNVHNVKNMLGMFMYCYRFNQPLDTWDINNVENMAFMFLDCRVFNQSLNNWMLGTNVRTEDMFLLSGISKENKPFLKKDEDKKKMESLLNKIDVFNILLPGDEPAAEFLKDNEMYQPFIVRNSAGLYTGDAIGWPAPSSSGKEFIECKDDTPVSWEGNSYGQYIKPNARTFIKVMISGSPTMVIKPYWYFHGVVPGTNFFQLVDTNVPVFKFMTTVLASQNLPSDFSAVGSDHCNQTSPVGVYQLEPISLEELANYVTTSGGKIKTRKIRKTRKTKKTKKIRKTKKNRKRTNKVRKTNRRKGTKIIKRK